VCRFLLHYNSNREGLDRTLAAVRAEGAQADALQADLGQVSGIHEFVER